jgi:hypothetical protein
VGLLYLHFPITNYLQRKKDGISVNSKTSPPVLAVTGIILILDKQKENVSHVELPYTESQVPFSNINWAV